MRSREEFNEIFYDLVEQINSTRCAEHEDHPLSHMPVDCVIWVPIEKLRPNDYNPNSVPPKELALLKASILADGYTQPIVTIYDAETEMYEIVDGFHRYAVSHDPEIQDMTGGLAPIVVLQKSVNERMASTVRHNRARGSHAVKGMANIVYEMLKNGWSDDEICSNMGMTGDELVRLKHVSGYAKLYADLEHSNAWLRGGHMKRMRQQAEKLRAKILQAEESAVADSDS